MSKSIIAQYANISIGIGVLFGVGYGDPTVFNCAPKQKQIFSSRKPKEDLDLAHVDGEGEDNSVDEERKNIGK